MIRLLTAFLILLGAVLLGVQLNQDPGYVYIALQHWTIESTVSIFILINLLLFLVFYLLVRAIHQLAYLPKALNQWHSKRLAQKAQAITRKGLIEYSEGYWQKAQNHLIQALPNTDTPILNYLTAARAAQKMGDNQLRDHYLREAQHSMPEAKVAVELTQAQLQLANHQWEQALATLRHLHDIAPHHPYVLKLLMQLYQEVRDWPHLLALLPSLKKYAVISQEEFNKLQRTAYWQSFQDAIKQNQPQTVTDLYQKIPKPLNQDPELIAKYVHFLIQEQQFNEAKTLLVKSLRKSFNADLIALYSELPAPYSDLNMAESLLKKNAHSAALYLCLGQLCFNQQLWGKAKYYLEKANELEESAEAYRNLGILYEKLNDAKMACKHYKNGLLLATKK